MLVGAILLLGTTTSCSFVDPSRWHRFSDPESQLDYLRDYLQDFATLVSTANVHGSTLYSGARKRYSRGLKRDFLRDISRPTRTTKHVDVGSESSMADIDRVLENFDLCVQDDGQRNVGWRGRRRAASHSLDSGIIECAQDAELEIVDAAAVGRLSEKLQRIVDVSRGNVIRWPWLTDEGWTLWWVLGVLLCVLLVLALIGTAGWFYYTKNIKSDDSWDDDDRDSN